MRRGRASSSIAALWIVPLIAAALFAVAGVLSSLWLQRSVQSSVGETLQTVLRADVEAMTFWLDFQTNAIESTARLPALSKAGEELMALRNGSREELLAAPARARFAAAVEGSTKTLHLAGYGLLDADGRVLASNVPDLIGSRTSADLDLLSRAERGLTVLAPPRVYPHDHRPYLTVLTRLACDPAKFCGVLRFRLRPDADFTRILNVARVGRTGETYAFDEHARFVSESRFVEALAQAGMVKPPLDTAILAVEVREPGGDITRGYRPSSDQRERPLTRMAADAVTGHSGIDLDGYRDYRGVTVVGAWTWLPTYNIGLATEVDRAEAFSTATVMRRALYLPFILLIGTSIVVFLLSHKTRALRSLIEWTQHEVHQRDTIIKTVFEGMADAVMIADRNGRMLFTNPAVTRITGIGVSAEPPHRWTEEYGAYLPDKTTPFPTKDLPLVRALRGESVDNVLMYLRNPKKPEGAFINISGRPLLDAEGEISGGAIVFHDVTVERHADDAIRALNQELKRNNTELSSLNKELEAFSYSVSHDLRAPLRHINGFVDLLQKRLGPGLDDTARRHLSIVSDSARRMGALIDDLLAFSRMSRTDMHKTSVDLNAILHEAIAEARRDADHREIEWVIAPLPTVSGDRSMLRQALLNLLTNAVKYTRQQPHARIEVGLGGMRDGFVELFVRDNGVGFDMQYADKLFGVFQRLHRADEFEGTGIGLATVRRIVHRHGGRAWAEAALGAGATFFITLPLDDRAQPKEEIPEQAAGKPEEKRDEEGAPVAEPS